MTVDQCVPFLHVSRATVYAAVKAGHIPSIRLGPRRIVIPTAAFIALVQNGNVA